MSEDCHGAPTLDGQIGEPNGFVGRFHAGNPGLGRALRFQPAHGNEHLDRLLSDPELAAAVARAHADAREMDQVYAMNLAMIRTAAQMTQVEDAHKLSAP